MGAGVSQPEKNRVGTKARTIPSCTKEYPAYPGTPRLTLVSTDRQPSTRAAMTSFALALLHDLDATVMILIWNLGMAALIAGVASAFGRTSLEWVATYVRPFHRGFPADDNYFPNREPFCGFGPS